MKTTLITICFYTLSMLMLRAQQWESVSGQGRDIGVGANGTVWTLGWASSDPNGYPIYKRVGSDWQQIGGVGVRIDVDPQGNAWHINSGGLIYRWTGNDWQNIGGQGRDIGIGANGAVWLIGWNRVPGGYSIHRWNGSYWQDIPGGALRIDVDPQGNAWIANDQGYMSKWNGSSWEGISGQARDISVGADGSVWCVGWGDQPGGSFVYKRVNNDWQQVEGGLQNISVGRNGNVWGVNLEGGIWQLPESKIRFPTDLVRPKFILPIKTCVDWPTRETNRPRPTCNNCNIQPLTAVNAKMWATGSTLRVRMVGGSNIVRSKVQQFANEWSNHANIRFNFINSGDAEIIITFGNDGKSYSKIGKDAVDPWFRIGAGTGIVPNETMHFGWLTDDTPTEEFRRTVLHEFGHALGFIHEHQNPSADIPWNREAVYASYSGAPNNWSREEIDVNLFQKYGRNQTQFTQYDPTSIMHYPIDPAHTLGGFSTPWNTTLSPTDIAFARAMYPAGRITGNRIKVTIITGIDDLRVNSQAFLAFKLRSGAVREMQISLNKGVGWGGRSTNFVEIPMPEGTSAGDVTQCKLIFASGKQFPWDNPDNWDVERAILEWVTPENFATILSDQRGTPFIRFANTGDVFLFNR